MRILGLVTDAFGGYGGIAKYNCDLFNALAAISSDNEIMILPRIGEDRAIEVCANLTQKRPILTRIPFAVRAVQQALRWKPDVIYCGHVYHGPLAVLLAKISGAKLVSQLHGTEVWRSLSRRHLRPLQLSNLVLCVSRDTRARYAMQGSRCDNSFVLANTVSPAFELGDRSRARARYDVGASKVLLSVSRLDTRDGYKGHGRVIEAMPQLTDMGSTNVIYLIAGEGESRMRLEQLARQHGVAERVRFLGKVDQGDLPDLYRAADLFVLPSMGEGFGIVYLEAMACGTPALGLAIGGTADPLSDGELGILVPVDASLASAISAALARDKPDALELSQRVRERFGIDAFRKRVAQAFDLLTG